MKNIFISLFLIQVIPAVGQTFEELSAKHACECIKQTKDLTKEKYFDCISAGLATVATDGKHKEAMNKINTVEGITESLKNIDILLQKTCLLEQYKNPSKAKNPFYEMSSNEAAANACVIGEDLMEAKKFELAIESFEIATKNDKNFVRALDDMAASYRWLEKFDKAIHYYKESLKIYPQGNFALMNIGVIYFKKKDYKTSSSYYQKLINFHPKNAEGYFGIAKNQMMTENLEDAAKNLMIAHRIYVEENSDYIKDTETLLSYLYNEMKNNGKEDIFIKIATEYKIEVKK